MAGSSLNGSSVRDFDFELAPNPALISLWSRAGNSGKVLPPMPDANLETLTEDPRWEAAKLAQLAAEAAAVTLRHLDLDPAAFEISLLGCDDARICILNSEFREKPLPTNVLSWPSADRSRPGAVPVPPEPGELGDIAISYDTCHREATEARRPFADHTKHLIVHSTLHLLGYDHERDDDAALMQALEIAILSKLGIADPYDLSFGKD